MKLAADRVVVPDGGGGSRAIAATLEVDGGRITAVRPGIDPAAEHLKGTAVPGFVDIHCHGAAGHDFGSADVDGVLAALAHHRSRGTTSTVASVVTAPVDEMVDQLRRLRPLVDAGEIAGFHLEGPFLSPERKGAHDVTLLRDPSSDLLAPLVDACRGVPTQITLAIELEHGREALATCIGSGMRVAFGHSDGDAAVAREAIDGGATIGTHLFNAMRGVHHREPGPVPVLLDDARVTVELICDGTHLDLEVATMAIRAAGRDRVALITDAMAATGQPDGRFSIGSLAVVVKDGVARLDTRDGSPGAIAGSTLTLGRAFELLVGAGHAITDIAHMAATVPARAMGLSDVGVLAEGRFADLCEVDDRGRVLRVLRRGAWVD